MSWRQFCYSRPPGSDVWRGSVASSKSFLRPADVSIAPLCDCATQQSIVTVPPLGLPLNLLPICAESQIPDQATISSKLSNKNLTCPRVKQAQIQQGRSSPQNPFSGRIGGVCNVRMYCRSSAALCKMHKECKGSGVVVGQRTSVAPRECEGVVVNEGRGRARTSARLKRAGAKDAKRV